MKTSLKKMIISVLCLGGVLTMTGCDLSNLWNNKERTANDAIDDIVDKTKYTSEGYFRSEKVYNANGSGKSYVLSFDKQGGLEIEDLSDNSTIEYTYKVIDNLVEVKDKSENPITNYLDLCDDDNLIFVPNILRGDDNYQSLVGGMVAVLQGVVASEKAKSTCGYHISIVVKKGDLPAVLKNDKSSKGLAYAIYKNGTWNEKASKYIAADQIAPGQFDTSEVGTKLVDVTINSKTYKAPFVVWGETEA